MTCTTLDTDCCVTPASGCLGRNERRAARLAKLVSRIGEQLFHYRYVRAELIERTLNRNPDSDRKAS